MIGDIETEKSFPRRASLLACEAALVMRRRRRREVAEEAVGGEF
jgi:hypothetical protein